MLLLTLVRPFASAIPSIENNNCESRSSISNGIPTYFPADFPANHQTATSTTLHPQICHPGTTRPGQKRPRNAHVGFLLLRIFLRIYAKNNRGAAVATATAVGAYYLLGPSGTPNPKSRGHHAGDKAQLEEAEQREATSPAGKSLAEPDRDATQMVTSGVKSGGPSLGQAPSMVDPVCSSFSRLICMTAKE